MIEKVADDVWLLCGFPSYGINAYIAGDVLIDAMTRWGRRIVLGAARAHDVSVVALTHCHPDHQGCAALVCRTLGIPLACHQDDVAWMEGERIPFPNLVDRHGQRAWLGPAHTVERRLRDGDWVGDFRVVHAPGHTPGHVVYFRDADRLAIVGDLCSNQNLYTRQVRLAEPPAALCTDIDENRRSIHKLLDLEPSVVCMGHGPPLKDLARLQAFAAGLEA